MQSIFKIIIGFLIVEVLLVTVVAQGHSWRKLQQFKKMRLIEYLDMADSLAERFFVVYNRHQKEIRRLRQEIRRLTRQLGAAIRRGNSEELQKYNTQLVEEYKKLNRQIERSLEEIRSVLGEKKFAKFLVFEARFREESRKIQQQRQRHER